MDGSKGKEVIFYLFIFLTLTFQLLNKPWYCMDGSKGKEVIFYLFIFLTLTFQLLNKPWSQVSSLLPPRFLPSIFIAHRAQQSHCSSIFLRVLRTHAPSLSASQFVHKKKSQPSYMSMHSAGLELTKLTYTRLEDNLIRHRGDRYITCRVVFITLADFDVRWGGWGGGRCLCVLGGE